MLSNFALALVSAAVLAYEVLLVRLLSIVQWHHFAYMAISIALLGFGISGTILTLGRTRLVPQLHVVFVSACAIFALTAVVSFLLLQQLPFNALEIVWEPSGLIYLGAMYALLAVPFTAGATAIGLAFLAAPQAINRVYLWNLVGSGAGAAAVVLALTLLSPMETLHAIAISALLAALIAANSPLSIPRVAIVVFAAAVGAGAWLTLPDRWTELNISQYKPLRTALRVLDAELEREYSGPLGLVSAVDSPTVPLRYLPGLSLNAPSVPPDQIGVFTDGDGLTAIDRYDEGTSDTSYLEYTTDALAYALIDAPSVLVLGVGGGHAMLQAVHHRAAAIDGVELNPHMIRLLTVDYADFAGRLGERKGTSIQMAEARNFIARTPRQWDLVQVPLLDAAGTAVSGVQGLSESYIYTVEAFELYLSRLQANGWLSLTRWLRLPPSDTLRLIATAILALERKGVPDPGERLIVIRGPDTATVLIKRGEVEPQDIAALKDFVATRSFDLAYYPGMAAEEANRRNILPEPYLFDGIAALLGADREAFIDRYKFDISSTDDRPYFFDFFKWRTLPELLSLRRVGGAALLDWGELILFATLVQAVLLSAVLILLPLTLGLRRGSQGAAPWRLAAYFSALGLAFLFVEIAFIQRFVLFLGHPIYAVSVGIAGFLVFAGVGSGLSAPLERFLARAQCKRVGAVDVAAAGIIAFALIYLFALGPTFERLAGMADIGRVALSLALIAPLAFFMGMPFPLGLAAVSRTDPQFVPWAWGLNGCASVISAILATILAMHFGFAAVIISAAALYGVAALLARPMFELSNYA